MTRIGYATFPFTFPQLLDRVLEDAVTSHDEDNLYITWRAKFIPVKIGR